MTKETKINLLYVITKLELGGAQKYLLNQIQGIDQNIFTPFLFTAGEGMMMEQAQNIPGLRLHRSLFLDRSINVFKDLISFIEIYIFIKKNNINVVHTHSSKAGVLGRLAAKAAGIKWILHNVHGWSFHNYQPKVFYYLCVLIERFCARFTDYLIVVSEYDQQIGQTHSIYPKEGYALIRFGLKFDHSKQEIARNGIRHNLGLSESDFVVGMVACFKPQKAPLDYIRLAVSLTKIYPRWKFVLVGDGVLRNKIIRAINEAGLEKSIILTGWRQDMPDFLSVFDLFVLTSLWEGLPIVVMEAMASGVPIIATDTGGVRELLVSGTTGYLVKPKDMEGMKDKIEILFENPVLRKSLAEGASALIEDKKFSLEYMIQSTNKIYGLCHATI